MAKILIVDDELDIAELISDVLVDEGYETVIKNAELGNPISTNSSGGINEWSNGEIEKKIRYNTTITACKIIRKITRAITICLRDTGNVKL